MPRSTGTEEGAIQHFHLHMRQGGVLVCPDDSGADFESVEAAYLEAFRSGQELWPILLENRRDPRRYAFEITNSAGVALIELPFSELLDTCHDTRHGRPAFDKEAFLEAVETARQLNRKCAELTRQLGMTREAVRSLMAVRKDTKL